MSALSPPDLPPGLARKIAGHVAKTHAYVLAFSGDCVDIRSMETSGGNVPGRDFRSMSRFDLEGWKPPVPWLLGVLLCPGDTLEPLLEWARRLKPAEVQRIRVYHVDRVDVGAALAPWSAAGLPPIRRHVIRDWKSFHALFGRHHAIQVYEDHMRADDASP